MFIIFQDEGSRPPKSHQQYYFKNSGFTPDIKGLTIEAGLTQEPEIMFQVPYLNLIGKGLSTVLLQNTEQLKAGISLTLSFSINGENINTTQNLTSGTVGIHNVQTN